MEIKIVRQILEGNEDCISEIKRILEEKKVLMINIMGSPGAGKTSFIKSLIQSISCKYRVGVIEVDIVGKIDAERIGSMNIPVVQLNTEGACHIEAMSIKNILTEFSLDDLDILLIENIGNLVCPAEFELGEDLKIVILSIPEGDDKVEKYPLIFTKVDALILNKYDMKEYFNFNEDKVLKNMYNVNKDVEVFNIDSQSGEGIDEFVSWMEEHLKYYQ